MEYREDIGLFADGIGGNLVVQFTFIIVLYWSLLNLRIRVQLQVCQSCRRCRSKVPWRGISQIKLAPLNFLCIRLCTGCQSVKGLSVVLQMQKKGHVWRDHVKYEHVKCDMAHTYLDSLQE